jgi:hypothetical protein
MNKGAEGEQHQPEPNAEPAEISAPAVVGRAEQDDADQHENRRHFADVEGQDLGDKGAAEVGAEHDGERRRQADRTARGERRHHQPGCGAALQDRGYREAG